MTDIDLNFLARQMQRMLSQNTIHQERLDAVRREVARAGDDTAMIKGDLLGIRSEILGIRSEIAALRSDMRAGFDTLDARLRPLENIEP
jgi:predicted  nucleic acid-binding Zn-ribbon protein